MNVEAFIHEAEALEGEVERARRELDPDELDRKLAAALAERGALEERRRRLVKLNRWMLLFWLLIVVATIVAVELEGLQRVS